LINYKLKQGIIRPDQVADAPGKNVITRSVGYCDYVEVDIVECNVQPGDRFLLCSDGLYNHVEDLGELSSMLGSGDLIHVAHKLINVANERGGRDNITVLLVDAIE